MINAISIALSGLNAASTRLNASASNIANTLTENFVPQNTITRTKSSGGVQTTIINSLPPVENNLTTEIVNIKTAKLAYKANLKTIAVTGELFDELLDSFNDE